MVKEEKERRYREMGEVKTQGSTMCLKIALPQLRTSDGFKSTMNDLDSSE